MRILATTVIAAIIPIVAGCAFEDSHYAERAKNRLIGMSEVDLETCLGAPDQHATFGATDILTYYTNSSSSTTWSLPIVQGPSYSNGGNCHMTVRFDNEVATRILYSGEKNSTGAPSSYCAPIVRTCLDTLNGLRSAKGTAYPAATPFPHRPGADGSGA